MKIRKFNSENEELIDLLCSNLWPFHVKVQLGLETIKKAIEKGYYSEGREKFKFSSSNRANPFKSW